jgi:hypothetical protein
LSMRLQTPMLASSQIQLLFSSFVSKSGLIATKKRNIWWICMLEMLISLRMHSLKLNNKLVFSQLRRSLQPLLRLRNKTTPSTTMLTCSTRISIWLKNRTRILKLR